MSQGEAVNSQENEKVDAPILFEESLPLNTSGGKQKITQAIFFTPKNSSMSQGVPIESCCVGEGLRDPERTAFTNEMFNGYIPDSVSFKLDWRGYAHVNWTADIPTRNDLGRPLARRDLAYIVGNEIKKFIQRCSLEKWVSTDADWSVGDHGRYSLDRILIENLHTGDGHNWRAGFRVRTTEKEFWSRADGLLATETFRRIKNRALNTEIHEQDTEMHEDDVMIEILGQA